MKNVLNNEPQGGMIRKAKITDAVDIQALLNQLGYPAKEEIIATQMSLLDNHPDHEILVYDQQDKVVGFISVHFLPQLAMTGDFANIAYFCVDADNRSSGIGAVLLERAEQLIKERRCDRVFLHCNGHRADAHRFYERSGYIDSPKYYVKKFV